jgi:hypothetical protein
MYLLALRGGGAAGRRNPQSKLAFTLQSTVGYM